MKTSKSEIISRMIRKAEKGICHQKIVAIGLDSKGRFIGIKANSPRYTKKGGGWHAEEKLIHSCPRSLDTIYICRISGNKIKKMHPCTRCKRIADRMGIKILSIEDL